MNWWRRVTHICISKIITIVSDNGLSPVWRQAIMWTNAGILLIGPLGINFSDILIEIHIFSFEKIHLKMSYAKANQWHYMVVMVTQIAGEKTVCSPVCSPMSSFLYVCKGSDVKTLQWRHNGCNSFSDHQPHDCLLNHLFRRRSKKISKLHALAFVWGIHQGLVNSPHKWPVTRKMFPFDDVIMAFSFHNIVMGIVTPLEHCNHVSIQCP